MGNPPGRCLAKNAQPLRAILGSVAGYWFSESLVRDHDRQAAVAACARKATEICAGSQAFRIEKHIHAYFTRTAIEDVLYQPTADIGQRE